EASAGIEHPLGCFPADHIGEKFLHAIAPMAEMKRFALFFAQRQELLRRKSIGLTASKAHDHIQALASIDPCNLLPIQQRRLTGEKTPRHVDPEVWREL